MTSTVQPITLYSHAGGPNPWKVVIVMKELGIPYKSVFVAMGELHKPAFEKINPNGRVPAIEDPNTGITLWESGAIIEYLVETYDKKATLTYTTQEKYHVSQWLFFQVSGQGPYYGQATWFKHFHPERIESAIQRYKDQILRVIGVLNSALEGKQYLVGDKCTIADLSFVTWEAIVPVIFAEELEELQIEKKYPNYFQWNKRLNERPAVKETYAEKQAAMAASH